MKKVLVLFFTSVLLNSCNFNANASYENEKVEKENAESVIGLLYLYTSRNSFDEVTHWRSFVTSAPPPPQLVLVYP